MPPGAPNPGGPIQIPGQETGNPLQGILARLQGQMPNVYGQQQTPGIHWFGPGGSGVGHPQDQLAQLLALIHAQAQAGANAHSPGEADPMSPFQGGAVRGHPGQASRGITPQHSLGMHQRAFLKQLIQQRLHEGHGGVNLLPNPGLPPDNVY